MKIRKENSSARVTVIDEEGYAMAQFFYQAGADSVPRNDAQALAELFMAAVSYLTSAEPDRAICPHCGESPCLGEFDAGDCVTT